MKVQSKTRLATLIVGALTAFSSSVASAALLPYNAANLRRVALPSTSATDPTSPAALAAGFVGSHITITCKDGPVAGLGTITGTPSVSVTYYQEQTHPNEVLLFQRMSQFNGNFTITAPSPSGGMSTETVQLSGALSESKFGAHGMPLHLVGISSNGRALDIEGDEYYGTYTGMQFYKVNWNGIELSHDCRVNYE